MKRFLAAFKPGRITLEGVHLVSFYGVLGLVAAASLCLIPVKWDGLSEVSIMPFPSLSDVLENLALALQGHSNGYSRAFYGCSVFIFISGAFTSVGRYLLKRLSGPAGSSGLLERLTGRERVSYYFIIGSLAYSLLWFGLGSAGFLNQSAACAAGLIGWIPLAVDLRTFGLFSKDGIRSGLNSIALRLRRLTAAEKVFLPLVGALMLFISSKVAFYPTGPDSLSVNGGLPNYYVQQGAVSINPHQIFSYLTQNAEMLTLWSLLLRSDFSAQLMIWGFFAVWILLIWGFLERHAGSAVSMFTVATILAIPVVSRSVNEFKNDAPVSVFIFAHYACLIEALRRPQEAQNQSAKWCVLSGLRLGGALGHKLLAVPVAFFSLLLLMGNGWVRRHKAISLRSFLIPCLIGTVITVAPWLMRTYRHTGNPIYPILSNFFDSHMDERDRWVWSAENVFPPSGAAVGQWNAKMAGVYFYDLLFGYNISHPNIADSAANTNNYRPTWGPSLLFALLFLPCVILPSSGGFRLCWIAAALSYLVLLYKCPAIRYHLGPLVFLVSTLFAMSWRAALDHARKKILMWFAVGVLALNAAVSNVWINSQASFSFLASGYAPGNLYNFQKDINDLYWMSHIFNTRSNAEETVLFAGISDVYPFKRKFFYNGRMNSEIIGKLAAEAQDSNALREQLLKMGVDHVIVSGYFYHRMRHPFSRTRRGTLEKVHELLNRHMRVRSAPGSGAFVWYTFIGDAENDEIQFNARDAEAFPGAYINEIRLRQSSGRETEAQGMLEAALPVPMLYVHKSEILRMLGDVYRSQGKRDELGTVLKLAVAHNPRSIQSLLELAQYCSRTDPPDIFRAVTLYQEAIQMQPNLSHAYLALGDVFLQLDDFENAYYCYEMNGALNAAENL